MLTKPNGTVSAQARFGPLLLALIAACIAQPVSAHGPGATPSNIGAAWVRDPAVLLGVLLLGAVYFAGYFRTPVAQRPAHSFYFVLALESLVVALCSPLEALSGALVSGHMVQHIVLISVTAPLLAISSPLEAFAATMPSTLQRAPRAAVHQLGTLGRRPEALVFTTVLSTATLWIWHIPSLYDIAVRVDPLHGVEHITLIGTGAIFWGTVMLNPRPFAMVAVFFGALQCSLLGVLMMVATHSWYGVYNRSAIAWGMTPLQDQQLAGVLMWVVGSFVYLVAAVWLFHRLLAESDQDESPSVPLPGGVASLDGRHAS